MTAALDAALMGSVFAVDPHGVGGVCVRSPPQLERDQWLRLVRQLLPENVAWRRMPSSIPDERLLGGLDLVATLRANRPVAERGVLASCDEGVLLVAMAERLTPHIAGILNSVLDLGEVHTEREGISGGAQARVGIIALDEGSSDEEAAPVSMLDRLALLIDFSEPVRDDPLTPLHTREEIRRARELLPRVRQGASMLEAIVAAHAALGAGSLRICSLALVVARIVAALDARCDVEEQDVAAAARLVLGPRATRLPGASAANPDETPPADPAAPPAESNSQAPQDGAQSPPPQGEEADSKSGPDAPGQTEAQNESDAEPGPLRQEELEALVIAAAAAAIPQGLLARLKSEAVRSRQGSAGGRFGALRQGGKRGRPAGVRSGGARGSRLNIIETLRAAAPWQRLRGRGPDDARVRVKPDDFRVTRYKQRSQTVTIFAVDASGSSALNRLAEAKGAVELLLADCYVRRDSVAVVGFRGRTAELLLPPTRSLVRAKRSLAGLPGGGATPLAAAIDAVLLLATQARRRGETPGVVLLTDGRANVARDGNTGRAAGQSDADKAAKAFGASRIAALFVDTSPQPQEVGRELARKMRAGYLALPYATAQSLSKIVRSSFGS